MAPEYSGTPFSDIRQCLTALVRHCLTPQTVGDRGAALLSLKIVEDERTPPAEPATDDQHEAADMAAVLSVLSKVVDKQHIPSSKDRRVLRFVLPIYEDHDGAPLRGAPLLSRRTIAGEEVIDGDKVVAPATIRTSYEPKALDWLGVILVQLEAERRGEEPPADLPHLAP
ncbi:MAG TPA: hypothetical protein VL979_07960 [Solirubrobacteraceae bacterium]|nr:hypothetical protein [Solirubrobacteraceae bacterium]